MLNGVAGRLGLSTELFEGEKHIFTRCLRMVLFPECFESNRQMTPWLSERSLDSFLKSSSNEHSLKTFQNVFVLLVV